MIGSSNVYSSTISWPSPRSFLLVQAYFENSKLFLKCLFTLRQLLKRLKVLKRRLLLTYNFENCCKIFCFLSKLIFGVVVWPFQIETWTNKNVVSQLVSITRGLRFESSLWKIDIKNIYLLLNILKGRRQGKSGSEWHS